MNKTAPIFTFLSFLILWFVCGEKLPKWLLSSVVTFAFANFSILFYFFFSISGVETAREIIRNHKKELSKLASITSIVSIVLSAIGYFGYIFVVGYDPNEPPLRTCMRIILNIATSAWLISSCCFLIILRGSENAK